LRDLISILNPENIIPAHGTLQQLTPMVELAREMGYKTGKNCHLMQDGQKIKL
jgi:ribonuclease J